MKNRHVIWLFAFVIVMTPLATGQAGSTAGPCYVAPGGDDVNTCSSVGTACATINGALAETSCSGTVFVAIGTYLGTGSEAVVSITRSIALSGGWDAGFTTQSGTSTIDGEDARRGLVIGSGVTAFVERFTISRGEGDGAAGISNEGNLTLFECTISNNMDIGDATSEGGGIRNGTTVRWLCSTAMSVTTSPALGLACSMPGGQWPSQTAPSAEIQPEAPAVGSTTLVAQFMSIMPRSRIIQIMCSPMTRSPEGFIMKQEALLN